MMIYDDKSTKCLFLQPHTTLKLKQTIFELYALLAINK